MYPEKLVESAKRTRSLVALCIDPNLENIPLIGLPEYRIVRYYTRIFEQCDKEQCYPAALKFNEAYFLAADEPYETAHGSNALVELLWYVKSHPVFSTLPLIIDCKREDIGETASHYARYYFMKWNIDAITLSPLLGENGLLPFLEHCRKSKGVYIHAKPTEKSRLQNITLNDGKQFSEWICAWTCSYNLPSLGLVISGKENDLENHLPAITPQTPLLIPGIGAQGGNLQKTAQTIAKTQNPLLHRIALGRSIAFAWVEKNEPQKYAEHALATLMTAQNILRGELHGTI